MDQVLLLSINDVYKSSYNEYIPKSEFRKGILRACLVLIETEPDKFIILKNRDGIF